MKKLFSIVLSLLMVMTLLAGCGNGNKSSGTRKGDADTLYVANDADAISLDPMGTNDNSSSKVLVQIYEGLLILSLLILELLHLLCTRVDQFFAKNL